MDQIIKIAFEKLVSLIKAEKYPVLISVLLTLLMAGFYGIIDAKSLDKNEIVGFFIAFFGISIIVKYLYIYIIKYIALVIITFNLLIFPQDSLSETLSSIKIVDVPSSGIIEYDLREQSIYYFDFPLSELARTDNSDLGPEEIDCMTFRRVSTETGEGLPGPSLRFCGYADTFKEGLGSLLIESERNRSISAFDLIDLESGGGGNFGYVPDVPGTRLRSYLKKNNIEIEILSRAYLSAEYRKDKQFYVGFGLYGFLLFRDNDKLNLDKRINISQSFFNLTPDFTIGEIGLKPSNTGLILYPTTIPSEELYGDYHTDFGFDENCAEDCEGKKLESKYNYNYSRYALRKISEVSNHEISSMLLVFISANDANAGDNFYLSRINWSNAVIFNLEEVNDVDDFFKGLNNFFTFGLTDPPPNLFDLLRKFASSVGEAVLILGG